MKYKPKRDIPRAVRELKTLSPTKIRDWIREHRTKRNATGKREQVNLQPQAITMWFKRNLGIYEALKKELKDEELPKQAMSEDLFQNRLFEETASIKM